MCIILWYRHGFWPFVWRTTGTDHLMVVFIPANHEGILFYFFGSSTLAEGVSVSVIPWWRDKWNENHRDPTGSDCLSLFSVHLDNQQITLLHYDPAALFNKLPSPAPARDKEIRIKQIKILSQDYPGFCFTWRPKTGRSSSHIVWAPNPASVSVMFIVL